jgi:hypothetical protein
MQQADSQHGGGTSGRRLTFPTKLCCGKVADLCTEPGLEDALARAGAASLDRLTEVP